MDSNCGHSVEVMASNDKESSGLNGLSAQVVKSISINIIDPLVYLINKSILNGIFPDALKVSSDNPVYKRGWKFDLGNYRQISLLNVISQFVELIIRNRVVSFLERFSILSDSQHGFRKGRSTESASAKLFEFVCNKVDKGNYVVTILFDLSKAFDSVNKDILVDTLEAIGIRQCVSSFVYAEPKS